MYNFFDPDCYLALQALLLTASPYFFDQVRQVIERSGDHMCPNSRVHSTACTPNQIPHHFVRDVAVYAAISGEHQTGPNLFWALTALHYAHFTGNATWLRLNLPTIRRAVDFLELEPVARDGGGEGGGGGLLVYAPGSRMIDTFRRYGYTTDTNVATVHALAQLAAAERLVGDPARGAIRKEQAANVSRAVNALLWEQDHYVTSARGQEGGGKGGGEGGGKGGGKGRRRREAEGAREDLVADWVREDFVDYDANLMAVAWGVANHSRAQLIVSRVDANPLARAVPTWVSERLYEGDDSRPRGGTADSICGMGHKFSKVLNIVTFL
jgi:hypothetical protein